MALTVTKVLLLPTIFARLNEKTLYIFGGVNALALVVVWALYPETNQRTLEEIDIIFECDSIWNWEAEKRIARLKEEDSAVGDMVRRASSVHVPAAVKPEKEDGTTHQEC